MQIPLAVSAMILVAALSGCILLEEDECPKDDAAHDEDYAQATGVRVQNHVYAEECDKEPYEDSEPY